MIKVEIFNDKIDLADELQDDYRAHAKDAVRDAAEIWLDIIQDLLSLRHGTAQTVAPEGQPPEEDTGALRDSWRLLPVRVSGRMVTSGIQTNHPGASRLEFGFTDTRGIRTLPHPYISVSARKAEGPIGELLKERLG